VTGLARRVAGNATVIGEAGLRRLRDLGLPQQEIMDVILARDGQVLVLRGPRRAGCRVGSGYRELEPGLRQALVVGRPVAGS
jgi:hypothetical protein